MRPAHGTGQSRVRPAWLWATGMAWALLNLALLWIYYAPASKILVGDEFDYNQRALALLAGKPMPELFIWPPGQAWFIALVYRLFCAHVLAVQLVQIAALALCAVLRWVPSVARRQFEV